MLALLLCIIRSLFCMGYNLHVHYTEWKFLFTTYIFYFLPIYDCFYNRAVISYSAVVLQLIYWSYFYFFFWLFLLAIWVNTCLSATIINIQIRNCYYFFATFWQHNNIIISMRKHWFCSIVYITWNFFDCFGKRALELKIYARSSFSGQAF